MSGDFDPRDFDSGERDDGIHDREDDWLTLGRGPGSAGVCTVTTTFATATTTDARSATVTLAIQMTTVEALIGAMCSCAPWICRVGEDRSWSTTAIATTRWTDPNRGNSRPSAPFGCRY
jgi:hypothetical protein